jgi:hypothetical protein
LVARAIEEGLLMHVPDRIRNTGIRRFAIALGLLMLVGLVAGATFAFAGSGSANSPAQGRVFGGGRTFGDSCTDGSTQYCSGVTREFSFVAVSDRQGDGAQGTVTYGNLEFGGPVYVVRVGCLAVDGNVAEIGGTIVSSAALPAQVGDDFHMLVRDSGEPGSVARDGVGQIFVDPPEGKPTCGNVLDEASEYGFFTLAFGDVAVESGQGP